MAASQNSYYKIVKLLLSFKADVNLKNNRGYTALTCANESSDNYYKICEILL